MFFTNLFFFSEFRLTFGNYPWKNSQLNKEPKSWNFILNFIDQLFSPKEHGHRIISRNSEISWPSRSPDLTPPDYFLWGYIKERVYINNPHTIQQLKDDICAEIWELPPELLSAVMENAVERARLCEAENGGNRSCIIFHK